MKQLFIIVFLLISLFANQDNDIESKKLYLKYKTYPKRVFTNQHFTTTLEAIILYDKTRYNNIATTFIDEENIDIVTTNPQWIEKKENIFYTTIEYKTTNKSFTLPDITIALIKDDEIVDYETIEAPKILFEQIAVNQKLFSNILASDLKVLSVKTKQYNNNTLLSTIHIVATDSNLEDMKLKAYKEQAIESFSQKGNEQDLYYYIMIPTHTKSIKFTYYNTKTKEFVKIELPIILDEELVSTQTNLNPYNSNILKYKQIFAIFLFLISLGIYLKKKDLLYLIPTTVILLYITYLFIPNKKIILDKNTKVYILPTKNSTVFKILDKKELVEVINEKKHFTKILFENNSIGWIKDDK